MPNLFEQLLAEKSFLLADGATGTTFFSMGLQSGDAPELWNADHPDRVSRHYQAFVDAGSDLILTNSFGGTRYRLKLHNAQDRVTELNVAAAAILRQVVDNAGRDVVVAGSIGPTGEILAPLGTLEPEAAVAAFAEQALALEQGGADVIWVETMSSREEVELAVRGAQQTGLPIVFTMSFDTNGRTMMGVGAADMMGLHHRLGVHACGTNCGIGASEVVATILNLQASKPEGEDPILVAKANCGIPEFIDGEIHYNGTPEIMARYAVMARDAGARIVGGCCGTSAEHVAAMRHALDTIAPGPVPSIEDIARELGAISAGAAAQASGQHQVKTRGSSRRRRRR
ncbi:MAG: betaine--homocysteine S-methyltransferase [Gammaproteobacteria bacterium]|jgi:5-methyltetrahydrofolate--homocysteine methyltransferase|nr:betaine--homocysteine S-methyltransferase [Gammaproteobacteria bacterium]